jgi:hypothetical protein
MKEEFINTVPIIVPIFDGIKAMSPSVREWMKVNFPGAVDELADAPSGPGLTDVRVSCGRWWYYCDDTLPTAPPDDDNTSRNSRDLTQYDNDELARTLSSFSLNRKAHTGDESFRMSLSKGHFSADVNIEHIIYFNMVCIVKRSNHRKHNSHQWFFDGICMGLNNRTSFAFLTDCGTTYTSTCLARLFYELRMKTDLIGVTARQRVETPGLFFHPCEDTPFSFLQGDHKKSGDMRPCWKCYATYYMSPCPLQGFEFEATLIMNSAMFNLVEALPVMPGPCQLLNWQKMKEFRVVEEYFNLLFKGESDRRIPSMPHKFRRMGNVREGSSSSRSASSSAKQGGGLTVGVGGSGSGSGSGTNTPTSISPRSTSGVASPMRTSLGSEAEGTVFSTASSTPSSQVSVLPPTTPQGDGTGGITFTEFLRVNMRLAEDRILSFVCVFSTGFGTKWIPGATFFYQPEIRWETLLTQRRRWLNGTFASFLFFFNSKRASDRIKGGMFDSHKAGKNIRLINGLWALQLMQLVLVLFAPAVFGSASYIGVVEMSRKWKPVFGWATETLYGPVRYAELWIVIYFIVYILWTFRSFHAPKGRMPEALCRNLAFFGFFLVLPVYLSVWWTVAEQGIDVINVLVIGSLALPIVIALAQSVTSAGLYLFYLPWFMFLIVFFLVYIPSYSFARLWDTTWGNRATGNDSAITDNMVDIMKTRNYVFICILVVLNCLAAYAFIGIFELGYSAVLGFMLVVFFPMIVQLVFSFVFLFVAVPLRYLGLRPDLSVYTPEEKKSYSIGGSHNNSSNNNSGNNSNNNSYGNRSAWSEEQQQYGDTVPDPEMGGNSNSNSNSNTTSNPLSSGGSKLPSIWEGQPPGGPSPKNTKPPGPGGILATATEGGSAKTASKVSFQRGI